LKYVEAEVIANETLQDKYENDPVYR